ncbi:hypothetical protein FQ330_03155 [Agrococcus sediminis]|uniref:FtsK domain-containing protein n=1 Tax=Agrococcus sediminis TaxID=2599924 RepID=A0A5M8QNW2_9MICO|nr:FtsK/SpoIIIE domain-containing protein [Agrococcus sediminis]KAA6436416.1 hypothetical protein FQ330_03155 [Agrococcus sediminis]
MPPLPPIPPLPPRPHEVEQGWEWEDPAELIPDTTDEVSFEDDTTPTLELPPATQSTSNVPSGLSAEMERKHAALAQKRAKAAKLAVLPAPPAPARAVVRQTKPQVRKPSPLTSAKTSIRKPTMGEVVKGAAVTGRIIRKVWTKLTPIHAFLLWGVLPPLVVLNPAVLQVLSSVAPALIPWLILAGIPAMWITGIVKHVKKKKGSNKRRSSKQGSTTAQQVAASVLDRLMQAKPLNEHYSPVKEFEEEKTETVKVKVRRNGKTVTEEKPQKVKFVNEDARLRNTRRNLRVYFPNVRPDGAKDTDHFEVWMKLGDHKQADVERFAENIRSILRAYEVTPSNRRELPERDSRSYARFIVDMERRADILRVSAPGEDFFRAHPATDPMDLPLGITDKGEIFRFKVHHTMLGGQTGAGKGSFVQGIIRQEARFVEAGKVQLWGIDPKNAELLDFAHSTLFHKVPMLIENEDGELVGSRYYRSAFTEDEQINSIKVLYEEMKVRSATNGGRKFQATRRRPLIIMIIDEYGSMRKNKRFDKEASQLLFEILAQGRALGIFIIGATQNVTGDILGPERVNFVNFFTLKMKYSNHGAIILGPEAVAAGADPRENISGDMPGTGFAVIEGKHDYDDDGKGFIRFRFAYTEDKSIKALSERTMDPAGRAEREQAAIKEAEELLQDEGFQAYINDLIEKGPDDEGIEPVTEDDIRKGRIGSLYYLYDKHLDDIEFGDLRHGETS